MEVTIKGAVIKLTKHQIAKIEHENSLLQVLKKMKLNAESNPIKNTFLSTQISNRKDVEALDRVIRLVTLEKYQ